nr:HAD family phosphatase [Clostridia bacterium]
MKTLLIDFDGTIADSVPVYADFMLRILRENGIDYKGDIVKDITPLGYSGTARYFISLGVKRTVKELLEIMDGYAIDAYSNRVQAKPGAIEVLKRMKNDGYSLNILTGSPRQLVEPCLKRLGIYDLFDVIRSTEDMKLPKSDPEIFLKAAELTGEKPENILTIDDNLNALKTAKAAGYITCGVYDIASADSNAEIRAEADYYVDLLGDLYDILPLIK